jgi:exosortase K
LLTNKNIPFYITTAGIFLLLKYAFTQSNTNSLLFLLNPIDKVVGLMTGSKSIYLSNSGFYHENLNILIDKSCSGFNFWILSFLLFANLSIKYQDKTINKIISIHAALIATYFLTIFANSSRIIASIAVSIQTNALLSEYAHSLLHEAVGIITNLTFLVLVYYLLEKILKQYHHNAKLT